MSEASNDDVTRVIAQSGETTSGGEEGTASPLVSRGEAVGRYIIIDEIGRGGMGVVYAAYDPELDRKVALKLLRPKAASRDGLPRARERLAREAQAMAKLSHDNVVRVFDVGTHGDRVFVALEFIDGETLGRWLARERRSWQEVLPLFVQAGRGLAAAHAEGLIHRDFKPENVMLDRRGHVSVMDFGLARPAGNTLSSPDMPHDSVDSSAEIDLTATGFVIGTPAYMSPEQIAHAAIDPRADQFSFCVALFEGLYGRRPFAGKTMAELQKAIARSDPSERTDASAPGWLRRAVLRGLSPKAPDRWPSMNALLDVLDQPVDGARRHWVMGATVVGAATLGAVGYGLVEEAPGDPCGAADAALDDVWTEARRRAAASAFQSTSLPYAADAWERADGVLKSYASEWTAQRRDACEANKVRGDESAALFDRRIACLEGRKAALSSQLNVFEEADATVVERAYAAASSLPDLGWCGNASALLADVAPPDDHDVARRVDAVRERLAGVDALRNAGLVKRADETVESVLEAAVQTGYAPVRIEVVLGLAHTRFKAGRIEDAEAAARDALVLAEELGMDDVGAQAHRLLIEVLTKTAEHDEALMLSRVALAKLERLGAPAQRRADLYRTRALLYDARGEYDAAREDHERWVAMLDEGDSDPFGAPKRRRVPGGCPFALVTSPRRKRGSPKPPRPPKARSALATPRWRGCSATLRPLRRRVVTSKKRNDCRRRCSRCWKTRSGPTIPTSRWRRPTWARSSVSSGSWRMRSPFSVARWRFASTRTVPTTPRLAAARPTRRSCSAR